MNKSTLKAEFINAKIKDAKYIGVSIKTEGSSQAGNHYQSEREFRCKI